MSKPLFIKINDGDNVAITVDATASGTAVTDGVVTREDIPQGHKIALEDIPEDGEIIRYGVVCLRRYWRWPEKSWSGLT